MGGGLCHQRVITSAVVDIFSISLKHKYATSWKLETGSQLLSRGIKLPDETQRKKAFTRFLSKCRLEGKGLHPVSRAFRLLASR